MTHLDGNALAGTVADILGVEITTAIGRCGSCHHRFVFARAHAFITAIGAVLRCERCQGVLAVIVRTPREVLVNLSGLARVTMARSTSPDDMSRKATRTDENIW